MKEFFVSYTAIDKAWAEWIGFVLEEEGFKVIIQAWDFSPGSNFVLEMQKAASEADRTIMVLSPDYLTSQFASSEWAAAFAQDPQGLNRKLLPIVVRDCHPSGLLASVVHISLLNLDEALARRYLVQGVSGGRAKPSLRPSFPGLTKQVSQKAFPGAAPSRMKPSAADAYMPTIRRATSDVEKRQFIKQAFEAVSSQFRSGLATLSQHNQSIEHDFELNTATEFTAEIYIHGKSACRCRVWRGGFHSQDGISYAEGSTVSIGGGSNETLTLRETDGELRLSATMAMAYSKTAKLFDTKSLTSAQAADYLWRRFVEPMER